MTSLNYESVLHAVSQWPVERRAMLLHALVDGLKNEAAGRTTGPDAPPRPPAAPPATAQAAPQAAIPATQAQQWADEKIEERYRRGGRMG